MPMGLLFWLLMVLWCIFGLYWNWPAAGAPQRVGVVGGNLLLFILLFLLGWRVFGFVVQ